MAAPDIPLTPLTFLDRAALVHPERTAIVDGPRRFTYAQMRDAAQGVARGLRGLSLRPGDHVAFLAPNCAETLVAHFGVPLAGGVLLTINTRLAADEVRYLCEHSEAAVLVDARWREGRASRRSSARGGAARPSASGARASRRPSRALRRTRTQT